MKLLKVKILKEILNRYIPFFIKDNSNTNNFWSKFAINLEFFDSRKM